MFVCLNWEWLYIFYMIEKHQKKKNILWPVKITWNSTYLFIGTQIYWHTASPFVYESSIANVMLQELPQRLYALKHLLCGPLQWNYATPEVMYWRVLLKCTSCLGKVAEWAIVYLPSTLELGWLFNLFQSPRKGPKKMGYQYKKKFY